MMKQTRARMNGRRKAAVLMVLLGEEVASAVYKHLPDEQVQLLTREIAELEFVPPEAATTVLQEYHRLTLTQDYLAQGGIEYAKNLLVKAFGETGAKTLLEQVLRAQEASAGNFDSLQRADPQQLAKFVESEHPQTVALVLAHLGPKASADLLMLLPEKLRAQAVQRLAQLRQFSPEMVQKISLVLHKRLRALGEQSRRAYGGVKAVAELLNRIEPTTTKMVLEEIEQEDAELVVSIRNLMFTFEDLISVPEAGLRELLAQADKKTLALALKGAPEEVQNHIFKSMSSRAVEMLKEDMEVLGPVRARDVHRAQQEMVELARKLEAQGKMRLKADHDDEYVV